MTLSRRALLAAAAVAPLAGAVPAFALPAPDHAAVLETMRRATRFMVDEASVGGGYVWSALPDFSRR